MKQKDLRILVELRKNARASLTQISKRTQIPISTIYDRLTQKAKHLTLKHVALLNFETFGFNTRAQIFIKCGKNCKNDVLEYLKSHQNLNSLFRINNGYDFMVEVVFRNVKDLEEFIEGLEEKHTIKTKQVFYIIEDLEREKFLSNEVHLELLNTKKTKSLYMT